MMRMLSCSLGEICGFPWPTFMPQERDLVAKLEDVKAMIARDLLNPVPHAWQATTAAGQQLGEQALRFHGFKPVAHYMGKHDERVTLWFKERR